MDYARSRRGQTRLTRKAELRQRRRDTPHVRAGTREEPRPLGSVSLPVRLRLAVACCPLLTCPPIVRFHPAAQRVKEIIDSGELGNVKSISASLAVGGNVVPHDDIRFNFELGGGAMMDVGGNYNHSPSYSYLILTSFHSLHTQYYPISSFRGTNFHRIGYTHSALQKPRSSRSWYERSDGIPQLCPRRYYL